MLNFTINKIIPNQYPTYYKVMTDVVDVVVHTYGQGGFRTIIFLKSNGTVSVITGTDLVNNGVINIKK